MKSFSRNSLIILFFLFAFAYSAKAGGEPDVKEDCRGLIDLATITMDKGYYAKAFEYLTQAEVLAEKHQLNEELFYIKKNIGAVYNFLSNYGEAMGYYQQALKIAEETKGLEAGVPKVLNNIALLYYNEKNCKASLEYCLKAYKLAKAESHDYNRVLIASNISEIYNIMGDYKGAQRYLNEVKDIINDANQEIVWKVNYAESLILEGRPDEAQAIAAGLVKKVNEKHIPNYVFVYKLLSKTSALQNEIPEAIAFAKKGLLKSTEMKDRLELYEQLAGLHLKQKDYIEAFRYKDSVFIAKDSLTARINAGLFESNKVRLKIQEYQNELAINKEKQSAERKLYIVSIIFILIVLFITYRGLRSRIAKQRHEKDIADANQKIFNLEMKGLKNSIAEKNRTLSAKALYLSGRNELIEEVIGSLENSGNKEVQPAVKKLKSYLKSDAEWDDFIKYFEEVNFNFLKTLKDKHPGLNHADIRFLCYVFMNLDTKEIGNIFNITYNAAKKRKRRIKEKMQLDPDEPLYEYLLQLN